MTNIVITPLSVSEDAQEIIVEPKNNNNSTMMVYYIQQAPLGNFGEKDCLFKGNISKPKDPTLLYFDRLQYCKNFVLQEQHGLANTIDVWYIPTHKIKMLCEEAIKTAKEDNIFIFSEDSKKDIISFFISLEYINPDFRDRVDIYLLPTYNFRAVWKNAKKEHIGLQFLGNGEIQYVFFKKKSNKIYSHYGKDTFDSILKEMKVFDIN